MYDDVPYSAICHIEPPVQVSEITYLGWLAICDQITALAMAEELRMLRRRRSRYHLDKCARAARFLASCCWGDDVAPARRLARELQRCLDDYDDSWAQRAIEEHEAEDRLAEAVAASLGITPPRRRRPGGLRGGSQTSAR
jgi:hypothetical protein